MNRSPAFVAAVVPHFPSGYRESATIIAAENALRQMLLHDLKLPLTVLKGELEALQDGIHQWTPAVISSMLGELDQMNTLLNTFEPSNEETRQQHPISLSGFISRQQSQFYRVATQTGLTLRMHIQPHLWVDADITPLKRIMQNLLSNSIKYTKSPGTIDIQLKRADDTGQCELIWQDSSPGVSLHELPLLARAHFRTHSATHTQDGKGLGLWGVKQMVQQLNGSVNFSQSSLGGLGVTISLPYLGY
ncbi:sensor histidine kinase [Shewanella mangrovi]|nr:ATP-binding protein [Shewanella mangrovi]